MSACSSISSYSVEESGLKIANLLSAGPTGAPSGRSSRSRASFWRRTRGERLVAYLAHRRFGIQCLAFHGQGILRVHGGESSGSVLCSDRVLFCDLHLVSVVHRPLHRHQFLQSGSDRQENQSRASRLDNPCRGIWSSGFELDHSVLSRHYWPVRRLVSICFKLPIKNVYCINKFSKCFGYSLL